MYEKQNVLEKLLSEFHRTGSFKKILAIYPIKVQTSQF